MAWVDYIYDYISYMTTYMCPERIAGLHHIWNSDVFRILDVHFLLTCVCVCVCVCEWQGSTTYMSPERISGLQYIWNSDIWSLGISLVEIATGCFPYQQPGSTLYMYIYVYKYIHMRMFICIHIYIYYICIYICM